MPTIKKRHPIAVQLIEGIDDDLIKWREALPEGSRSQAVKTLLRMALGMPERKPPIQTQIEAVERQIETLSEVVETNGVNRDDLEDAFNAIASDMQELREMFEALNAIAARGGSFANLPSGDLQIEEAPRLEDELLSERERKMRRAAW